jgi:hypothetical protein
LMTCQVIKLCTTWWPARSSSSTSVACQVIELNLDGLPGHQAQPWLPGYGGPEPSGF